MLPAAARAQVLEDAREEIARLLGTDLTDRTADRLIFTSGGTEANNLALIGLTGSATGPGRIIISSIEHPSITVAADFLARRGWQIDRLAVDQNGVVQGKSSRATSRRFARAATCQRDARTTMKPASCSQSPKSFVAVRKSRRRSDPHRCRPSRRQNPRHFRQLGVAP